MFTVDVKQQSNKARFQVETALHRWHESLFRCDSTHRIKMAEVVVYDNKNLEIAFLRTETQIALEPQARNICSKVELVLT